MASTEFPRSNPDSQPQPEPVKGPSRPWSRDQYRLNRHNFIEAEVELGFQSPGGRVKKVLISFAALVIDFLFIVSMSCFFLVLAIALQKVSFHTSFIDRSLLQETGGAIFALIGLSYVVLTQAFRLPTLGKWACRNF